MGDMGRAGKRNRGLGLTSLTRSTPHVRSVKTSGRRTHCTAWLADGSAVLLSAQLMMHRTLIPMGRGLSWRLSLSNMQQLWTNACVLLPWVLAGPAPPVLLMVHPETRPHECCT